MAVNILNAFISHSIQKREHLNHHYKFFQPDIKRERGVFTFNRGMLCSWHKASTSLMYMGSWQLVAKMHK